MAQSEPQEGAIKKLFFSINIGEKVKAARPCLT